MLPVRVVHSRSGSLQLGGAVKCSGRRRGEQQVVDCIPLVGEFRSEAEAGVESGRHGVVGLSSAIIEGVLGNGVFR